MITNLKVAIDRAGLKQKHLAALIGIDYAIMSKIVSGDRPLSPENAKKLAKILRVSVASIVGVVG